MKSFNEYQDKAHSFSLPTAKNILYLTSGLAGEVGEFSSLVAKSVRDGPPQEYEFNAKKELGDILWFLANICSFYGWDFEQVAQMNIAKLESRKERGKITGSGDTR